MNTMKRIVTGLVFAATVALALVATGGDAHAKVKGGGGLVVNQGSGGITIILDVTTPTEAFHVLGVTWE